ncbi:helicase-exonuclease AddAB subunit AddA [Natranaerobius thermophilus]|uniref:ATP-dependent helicase/nuclease subunit A n=1 Tax=Natranaerobius thermophilus (strain ATCC BAA-1301 / DSM 18059 / JW/NM-WN-LF) TaxID=457570 RepID=ADDA_NATTJ|nr:helicase-exonuclease AddAB subunit AddA [Natranaerobius thermophilus]B2A610.1 RecName: Full=ATP-dependent helicase/nuclease subunit A; AltName: Full=ATP-dependent helicase/nuclease AddA; AltName: Full=DNA 3'-5' helicase AddA [Natranaerobius thermophilus JW/NM-WN-LF]ACB85427.1 recombination helicase AddA [Natranaerobius thermophilus JW/NM-WN-LF]
MVQENNNTQSKWTDSQRQVIDENYHHILVSAGAGAGKTAVLVQRIISKLIDPHDDLTVNGLLVVTFTEKAANEMRDRIARELKKALSQDPENDHLKKQLYLLNKANISTLHSFCLEILRHYFYYLDIDPAFSVASEYDVELLRQSVIDNYLEEEYGLGEQSFYLLVDSYGGDKNDEKLKKMILTLHRFSRSHPRPRKWLQSVKDHFEVSTDDDLTNTVYYLEIQKDIETLFKQCINYFKRALQTSEQPGGPYQYAETLLEEIEQVQNFTQQLVEVENHSFDWNSFAERVAGFKFSKLPSVSKNDDVDEDLKKDCKKLRDHGKKTFQKLVQNYFTRSKDELLRDLQQLSPLMNKLIDMVINMDDKYEEVKKQRGIMDFSDLEHYVYELLDQYPEIVSELHQRYDEVMVDEYQDINQVQNAILEKLTGQQSISPDLFMVGDVKQSIYRFRLAEPELFLNKYDTFDQRSEEGSLIELQENFRSSPMVLESVNYLFSRIMTGSLSGIEYNEKVKLIPASKPRELYLNEDDNEDDKYEGQAENENQVIDGRTEVHLLENKDTNSREEDTEREAQLIATTINSLVEEEYRIYDRDLDDYRKLDYSDFVILSRKTKEQAELVTNVFQEHGVPLYAELDTGYFAAQEVQVMLSLLKIIDNPRQDIPLAGVLRSPLVGLDSNELVEIRRSNPGTDYYEACKRVLTNSIEQQNQCSEKTIQKMQKFFSQLERWRRISRERSLAELIWDIYQITDYLDYVAGFPGGRERQANLWSFYDRALQFDSFSHSGLVKFLNFIEKLVEQDFDLGKARTVSENENVVRLMSIHKSKGLEFPVVFVMGLGNNFNFNDQKGDLLLHKDLGLGPKLVDLTNRIKYPTIAHQAIKGSLGRETLAEEMRILYVAMTRAEEKLFLVGSGKDIESKISVPEEPAAAQNYLDWIYPQLGEDSELFHKIWNDIPGQQDGKSVEYNWKSYFESLLSQTFTWEVDQEEFEDQKRTLEQAISYSYPYNIATEIVGKMSVTDLAKSDTYIDSKIVSQNQSLSSVQDHYKKLAATQIPMFLETTEDAGDNKYESYKEHHTPSKRPEFLKSNSGLTGAEAGTSIHLAFQHLPINSDLNSQEFSEEQISNQLDDLVNKEIITQAQRDVISEDLIMKFFQSELGQAILERPKGLKRELPFTLGVPAWEMLAGSEECQAELEAENIETTELQGLSDETVVIQGVIDYLFWDGTNYYLIDFKTDKLNTSNMDEIEKRLQGKYRMQIQMYLRAITEIFNITPTKAYLYHVPTGNWIQVE